MDMERKAQEDAFKRAFGKRLKEARRARDLRGEETAELAGITPQFLSEVERGRKGMSSFNAAAMAKALGVTTDYLVYGRKDMDERTALAAEHLAALPPAQRDMAIDILEYTLAMIKQNIPE